MTDSRGKTSRPVPLSDLLRTVFSGTTTEQRLKEGRIWALWKEAVGEQIAARACPVRFSAGVLTVGVATGPWMQQLNFLKTLLIEKVNLALGENLVTEIYLKGGKPEDPAQPPPTVARQIRRLSPSEVSAIETATAGITDPELREAFLAVLSRHHSTVR